MLILAKDIKGGSQRKAAIFKTTASRRIDWSKKLSGKQRRRQTMNEAARRSARRRTRAGERTSEEDGESAYSRGKS